jgi:hypothetical protein
MVYVTHYRPRKFPNWVHRGANRKLFYLKSEVMNWLEINNVHDVYILSISSYKIIKSEKNEIFDNAMAVSFIRMLPAYNEHIKRLGTSVCVHVEGHDNYERPREIRYGYGHAENYNFEGNYL